MCSPEPDRPPKVERGTVVSFRGRCFKGKRAVQLFIGRAGTPGTKFASVRTNGSGAFATRSRKPAKAARGRYVVRACRLACKVKVTTALRVTD